MPGSAVLGSGVLPALVQPLDTLRTALRAAIGDRSWRVYVERHRWSGAEPGAGTMTVVSSVEITPIPLAKDARGRDLDVAGVNERGAITLTEVSLTYTEAELTGQPVAANEQWFYKFANPTGHGRPAFFATLGKEVLQQDWTATIGWIVTLWRSEA